MDLCTRALVAVLRGFQSRQMTLNGSDNTCQHLQRRTELGIYDGSQFMLFYSWQKYGGFFERLSS